MTDKKTKKQDVFGYSVYHTKHKETCNCPYCMDALRASLKRKDDEIMNLKEQLKGKEQ